MHRFDRSLALLTRIPFLLALICLQTTREVGGQSDDFSPRNTQAAGQHPLPPEQAIRQLKLPEGFHITLAAAEPDVQQPIAITFDDRGRLWVAESYSYDGSTFTDERHDRILIFEDTTGDGILDQRHVFQDGLTHLTGLTVGFGGVWISAPPHVAFIADRDGDDRPDGEMHVHLNGWTVKAEHNNVNGLMWGPDGWLYGRHGIKQPSLVGRPGDPPGQRVELSCCIWRYHPTRHDFEVVADGTINPWGLDFDDYGQGFLTTSVVDHLWHLVPGAHYERWKDRGVHPDPFVYEAMTATSGHRHWGNGPNRHSSHDVEGVIDFGGGHSHCDAMIYLGDRWPTDYRGSVFMSNIHGRRVNRDRLVRSTGPYSAEHADDFLLAGDPWFRAVSMEYGPDGDVYLTDWSDNGECHDRDGIHRTSGRIYKITWGPPVHVDVNLATASNDQLVEYQLHRNDWYARHARRILQERADAGHDLFAVQRALLAIFVDHPEITRKLRAMWTLHSIAALDHHWLLDQLNHDNEHVRAWSVRLLADGAILPPAAVEHFARLAARDDSWLVRITLASALRRIPFGQRWTVAVQLARRRFQNDPNLIRMVWYAVEPEVVADPQRAIRMAGEFTPRIRRWIARRVTEKSNGLIAPLFSELKRTTDPEIAADLLEGLNQGLVDIPATDIPATDIPATDIPATDIPATDIPATDVEIAGHELLTRFVHGNHRRARSAAVTAAALVGNEETIQQIRRLLHDADSDNSSRRAALAGLVRRRHASLPDDLRRLILANRLTESALRASTAVKDPKLAQTVLNQYAALKPTDRVAAIDFLTARRETASLLLHSIERQEIPARDLNADQARQIAAFHDSNLSKRLQQVWGTVQPTSAQRKTQIQEWTRKLAPSRIAKASLSNGREIYQQTCAACHKLFGEGRSIGPELTGANRRNVHYLVSNIIDPSETVPTDFRLAVVATRDGRIVSGILTRKTESSVTIQTAIDTIQLSSIEIETISVSSKSMMPDGLLDKLNESQIQDLFAYMMSNGPGHVSSEK